MTARRRDVTSRCDKLTTFTGSQLIVQARPEPVGYQESDRCSGRRRESRRPIRRGLESAFQGLQSARG